MPGMPRTDSRIYERWSGQKSEIAERNQESPISVVRARKQTTIMDLEANRSERIQASSRGIHPSVFTLKARRVQLGLRSVRMEPK